MRLKLDPIRLDSKTTYSVIGSTLEINGVPVDLSGDWVKLEANEASPMPDGLLAGERDPDTGVITLTVRAPHKANAPESERFPEPIELLDGESVEFPR